MRPWAILFLFGGIAGMGLDGLHVLSGAEMYPHPSFFGPPWWVFPEFGLAALMIAWFHLAGDRLFRSSVRIPSWSEVVAMLGLFAAQYFASGFLRTDSPARVLFQGLFALCVWLAFEGTLIGVAMALATAVAGTTVEIIFIKMGVFLYAEGSTGTLVLGVPAWLPFLYVSGAVVAANLARRLRADHPSG